MQDIPSRDQALEIAVVLKNNEKVDYCGNLRVLTWKACTSFGKS